MTGRERLTALMDGRPTDRLAWTTLVDENTLGALPAELRGMSCLDFYRYLRCDVLMLSGWGTPWGFASPRLVMPGVESRTFRDEQGCWVTEACDAGGVLTSRTSANWHPLDYPVKTIEDIRLLTKRYETAHYEEVDDREAYANVAQAVGDDGIITLFFGPSAIPSLLENQIGTENFYYLFEDYPDEMDALIRVMQEQELAQFEIAARHPCDVGILAENTSTAYISPEIYTRYNMPSQRTFVEAMHRQGKTAILHMCGHVRDLLPVIKETGLDGIHTLTPPPLGNTPWELALDVLGEELIIFGCLVPDIFLSCPLEEVGPALDRLITPRLRASRFILNPMADGIAVPLQRFVAIRDWVEQNL
ncbi:MAG: uroporphyrinogen decarboxylase family protein [Armatimonadota bacterium]